MLDRLKWQPLAADEALRLANKALADWQIERLPSISFDGRIADLPFYAHFKLVWIRLISRDGSGTSDLLMLVDKDRHFVLDGTSAPIHDANAAEKLALTANTAGEYIRFFCFFVYGDAGPFLIVDELQPVCCDEEAKSPKLLELKEHIRPFTSLGQDTDGDFRFSGCMIYGDTLFEIVMATSPGGTVTMVDDKAVAGDVTGDQKPVLPALYPLSSHLAFGKHPKLITAATIDQPFGPPALVGGVILDTLVMLLLEQALIAQSGHRLIARFNATVANQTPLKQFAELLANTSPVVVVESTIPFIEEVIARIFAAQRMGQPSVAMIRADTDGADDTRLRITVPNSGPVLVLLSLHAYRSIVDVQRVSHELGTRSISALIGCEKITDLPTSLREIVDVTLTLPPMSPAIFETLFQKVMGASPPPDWRQPDTHWVGNVAHTDLEHPSAFKLSPDEAVKFIRERVLERLRTVDPASGLGLKNLHGLAEARLFAEDLIADIHAAIAGQLPWSEVDRGVLLAGPPGTGKTTLARAIAKDCGVKFVNASAASWQSVGHLGDHIRAIRADFTQARRFAPAILFIDEIDSIGNREQMAGQHGMQYMVEVVNAVLEQMQGLDPSAPVFVIGATNHPERVDPALRRAGRLDRTIWIPYPNSEALAAIFDHYLKPLAGQGKLGHNVDTKLLGQMCLRKTGADVEFFVRGAMRRARKAGRLLSQEDLLDEVTGKGRDPNALPRMTPEEIENTAAHEAGHALARCLSSTKGKDIAFVSIVPRANGTLGFVMFAPSEKQSVTRAEYIEHLEIALAGRAAEEIRFGPDGISGGAFSDLKYATEQAQHMISQLGLGPNGSLVWNDTLTTAHLEETEKLLSDVYSSIKTKLRKNQNGLMALAEALKQKQELTGAEVLMLILT